MATTIYGGINDTTLYLASSSQGYATTSLTIGSSVSSTTFGPWYSSRTSLTAVEILNTITFDTASFHFMFYGCSSLTSLSLSNFNTSNVINMESMFYNCSKLTSLDISGFNTSNVTNMGTMFYGCTNLVTVYVSQFGSTAKLADASYSLNMFLNSSNLIGENGTAYDANYVDATYARIDAAGSPGYFTFKYHPGFPAEAWVNLNGYHHVGVTDPYRTDTARLFIDTNKENYSTTALTETDNKLVAPTTGTVDINDTTLYKAQEKTENLQGDSTNTQWTYFFSNPTFPGTSITVQGSAGTMGAATGNYSYTFSADEDLDIRNEAPVSRLHYIKDRSLYLLLTVSMSDYVAPTATFTEKVVVEERNTLHLLGTHAFHVKTPQDPGVIDRIHKGYITDSGNNILTTNSDGYLKYTPSSGISIGV